MGTTNQVYLTLYITQSTQDQVRNWLRRMGMLLSLYEPFSPVAPDSPLAENPRRSYDSAGALLANMSDHPFSTDQARLLHAVITGKTTLYDLEVQHKHLGFVPDNTIPFSSTNPNYLTLYIPKVGKVTQQSIKGWLTRLAWLCDITVGARRGSPGGLLARFTEGDLPELEGLIVLAVTVGIASFDELEAIRRDEPDFPSPAPSYRKRPPWSATSPWQPPTGRMTPDDLLARYPRLRDLLAAPFPVPPSTIQVQTPPEYTVVIDHPPESPQLFRVGPRDVEAGATRVYRSPTRALARAESLQAQGFLADPDRLRELRKAADHYVRQQGARTRGSSAQ